MAKKTVYVLHKNGANSHYIALKHLLNREAINLKYREFSIFGNFFKSLVKFDVALFQKQCINLAFLVKLVFSKNIKIVLGIAPYDSKLLRLSKVLKNHKLYYHTSWTYWDGTFQPKSTKRAMVKKTWKYFLENSVEHIFCVSQQSKNQLLENYNLEPQNISVVNHAVDAVFFQDQLSAEKEPLSFIYVGRLVPQKGIDELLEYFADHPGVKLSLMGSGDMETKVEEFSRRYQNISYYPYTNDKKKIVRLISTHQYFVLNAKKTDRWEELFGLALIESMAQNTIPIAADHSGPKEIIGKTYGYVFEEGNIEDVLNGIITKNKYDPELSQAVRKRAEYYKVEHISNLWKPILN